MQTESRLHFGEEEPWGSFRYSRLSGYRISARAPTNTAHGAYLQEAFRRGPEMPAFADFPEREAKRLPFRGAVSRRKVAD